MLYLWIKIYQLGGVGRVTEMTEWLRVDFALVEDLLVLCTDANSHPLSSLLGFFSPLVTQI